jgi:HK97 gp10 family phage protein
MITGVEELVAKLQTLKKSKAKAAIRKGTRDGAKIIQSVAKRLAPSKTGQLQSKIKVRSLPRSRVWTGTQVELQLYYGAFTELGTKHEKAMHFLQKASQQAGRQAINRALEIIRDEVIKS